jgi:hypothetical protein
VDHDPAGMKHVNGNLPVICTRARRAPWHTVVADTVAPWVARLAGRHPTMRTAGAMFR